MAETLDVVWIRGPGFGCRAVRDAWASCSVLDFIHRYCQDQVRFAISGRKGKEEVRIGCERICLGSVCSLGFSVFKAEGSCYKLMLRSSFAFVLC